MGFKRADRGRHAVEADIAALERRLHERLPASYRRFLAEPGARYPDAQDYRSIAFDHFYSLDAPHDYDDLDDAIASFRSHLPAGMIPIGCNSFGDQICLALTDANSGRVYLWDHEGRPPKVDPRVRYPWLELDADYQHQPDDWPGHPDLSLLADSFEEFLAGFRHTPTDDDSHADASDS